MRSATSAMACAVASARAWGAITMCGVATITIIATAITRPLGAQVVPIVPVVETGVPFDSAGRITVLTPTLVTRLGLAAPQWPVVGPFREARLYRSDDNAYVLVVVRLDGAMARFALGVDGAAGLTRAITTGVVAQGRGGDRLLGAGTGVVVSQPAGNTFVRNQTFLGLVAYGPATAALLSRSSAAAAAGGYFLAAGTSFFVAANTVKGRVVTRAQAARAAHGGRRPVAASTVSAHAAHWPASALRPSPTPTAVRDGGRRFSPAPSAARSSAFNRPADSAMAKRPALASSPTSAR